MPLIVWLILSTTGKIEMNHRLKKYYDSSHTVMSTEGLLDQLKSLLPGLSGHKMQPADFMSGGDQVNSQWAIEFRKEISRTFGNRKWVEENFSDKEIENKKLALSLSYDGGLPDSPADALRQAEVIVTKWYKQQSPKLKKYSDVLGKAVTDAVSAWDELDDPQMTNDGKQFLRTRVARRIQEGFNRAKSLYPLPVGGTGPLWFNGGFALMNASKKLVWKKREGYTVVTNALPDVTADDIVTAGKLLVDHAKVLEKYLSSIPWPGVDLDADFWREVPAEIRKEYQYDKIPGQQADSLVSYLHEWGAYLYTVATWLYQLCSNNSLDE